MAGSSSTSSAHRRGSQVDTPEVCRQWLNAGRLFAERPLNTAATFSARSAVIPGSFSRGRNSELVPRLAIPVDTTLDGPFDFDDAPRPPFLRLAIGTLLVLALAAGAAYWWFFGRAV